MPTEADTWRTQVVPKLRAAGWDRPVHGLAEQWTIVVMPFLLGRAVGGAL